MLTPLNRRQFLVRSGLAAAGACMAGCSTRRVSPNEKLNLGLIGTAHRAGHDLDYFTGENIVALCDVDSFYLAKARVKCPRAAGYADFRRMLERNDLDAVVVATPDHTHAVATVAALRSGRHVYCEKPLAHTVSEARRVAEAARRYRRVTQLGTQMHATDNYRQVVDHIRRGTIGAVREVHVWMEVGENKNELPPKSRRQPASLDWDLWLEPAQPRAYNAAYVPGKWRHWWAFGGGTLADFGCHEMDLAHWALGLRHPLSVETEGPPVDPEVPPPWLIVRYEYPAREPKPPVRLTWYHGNQDGQKVRPPQFARGELPEWGPGVLFIGDKGMLLSEYWRHALLPENKFGPSDLVSRRDANDYETKHHQEWIQAIKTGGATSCNFDYGGALTEAVLLGNAAYRSGGKIIWDPATLTAAGNPRAEEFLWHHYRASWSI